MKDIYKLKTRPVSLKENIIAGDKYRITVLTNRLFRLEYCEDGIFEDRATQTVLNRDFKPVDFRIKETDEELEIFTDRIHLMYNKQAFAGNGLSIQVSGYKGASNVTWYYGDEIEDLLGTARTLDKADGAIALEHGLMSKTGFAAVDDSKALIITEDGWVEPRRKNIKDIYFFGYGHDYKDCLRDFYYLCGSTPMLPRFALGNWWSRYFKYTEQSYMELMERFDKEGIPFTVAVLDMDWHVVDIDPKYGNGWTGYSWNKNFFPDPRRFMKWLHDRGMKITLNVHPADGVRAYEDVYPEMAKALGVDTEKEEPVNFDITSPDFMEAYFKYIHHPNEKDGVDFWWLDWQQGTNTKIEGLDPLWMLNHYHYLDSGRDGKRPMTFSRYAGPGSHRYPIGFSGDTVVTWESLDFQPYFTANASNIGFGWWSHDIGGHMNGYKDDEMEARWYQLGVFSPINRLHSTANQFNGKEPWRFKTEVRYVMDEFLRLRHRLLPYLYTMNYRAWKDGLPLVLPMYYENPDENEAYEVPNEYYFGTELIAAPITKPLTDRLNAAGVTVWLPEGTYIDFFNGRIYDGGRKINMYRTLQEMPVLAKAGAIIPMTESIFKEAAVKNPEALTIRVYAGSCGEFTLYEDDNETTAYENGVCVLTKMTWNQEDGTMTIHGAEGEKTLLPEKRSYTVQFYAVSESKVSASGADIKAVTYDARKHCLTVELEAVLSEKTVKITLENPCLTDNNITQDIYDFLNQSEIDFDLKDVIYTCVCRQKNKAALITELCALGLDRTMIEILSEMISAHE